MKWYYAIGSQPFGPVDRVELESLCSSGVVDTSTMVLQEGMYDWVPFVDLKKTTQFLPCIKDKPKVSLDTKETEPAPQPIPDTASKSEND